MNHPTRFHPKEVHGSTDPSYNNTLRPGDKPSEYSHRHYSNPQHYVPYSTHEHMPRYSRYGSTDPSYQNTLRPGDKRHPYSHLHHTDPKSVHVRPREHTGPYEKYGNHDPDYQKIFSNFNTGNHGVISSLSKLHTKVAKLESTLQNLNDFN